MSKVIGLGEAILDIVFNDTQPSHAIVGGSVFNAMVSLARLGHESAMITEVGEDKVGRIILDFMESNGMTTGHIDRFTEGQTAISLAFLDAKRNADYMFFKQYPQQRLRVLYPKIDKSDYFIFGSFYALNPGIRESVKEVLNYAREHDAFMLYDPNFRKPHVPDVLKLMLFVAENMEYADIVRCSEEDCVNLFKSSDMELVYKRHVAYYCPFFISTSAENGVSLFTPSLHKHYDTQEIEVVSTIGAGDNFNAGIIHALKKMGITRTMLRSLTESEWDRIIHTAISFATEVCRQTDNYLSTEFASQQ